MRLRLLLYIALFASSVVLSNAQESTSLTGQIDNTTPFVTFPISIADGQSLSATMTATNGDLDAYLLLVDGRGSVLLESDQESKTLPDPKIELSDLPAGQYQLIATRYNLQDGDTSGAFNVSVNVATNEEAVLDYADFITEEALQQAGYNNAAARTDIAEWTVLAYYGGDNNLEQAIINDIEEFELGGGSNEDVNIVALLDRSAEFYTDEVDDWSGTRIYHLQAATNPTLDNRVDTKELFALGETNTNKGETLAQFLVWGIRNYPAKNYIIAFASHGNGWQGVTQDDAVKNVADANIIPLNFLNAALLQADIAIKESGGRNISLVINDACLMGSLEYFNMLAAYADYVLASPEIVLSPALNMTLLTETLKANPSLDIADPEQLSTPLIQRYFDDIKNSAQNVYMGYALVDLTKIGTVINDVEQVAKTVASNPAAIGSLLGKARAEAYTYSAYAGVYTKVDIGDLLRQLKTLTEDAALLAAIQQFQDNVTASVIVGQAGKTLEEDTSYLHLYFPLNRDDFDPNYYRDSQLTEWNNLLRTYFNQLIAPVWTGDEKLKFHAPINAEIEIVSTYPVAAEGQLPVTNSQIGFSLDVEITGRKLARGQYTIVQDDVQLYSAFVTDAKPTPTTTIFVNDWTPGLSKRIVLWDGRLTQVSDGTNIAFETLTLAADHLSARMRAIVTLPDSETPIDGEVIFGELKYDLELGKIVAYATSAVSDDGTSSFSLPVGTKVTALKPIMGKGKRVTYEPSNSYVIGEDEMYYTSEIAPNGTYKLVFDLFTFGGQSERVQQEFTIDNTGVDAERVGFTLFDYEVNLTLPRQWVPLFPHELGFYTSYDLVAYAISEAQNLDPDGLAAANKPIPEMRLYQIPNTGRVETYIPTVIDAFMNRIDGGMLDAPIEETLDVGEQSEFTFITREDPDTLWYGVLLRTRLEYIVLAANVDLSEEDYAEVITLQPLDVASMEVNDLSKWIDFTVSYDRDEGIIPLPITWEGALVDTLTGMSFADEQVVFELQVVGGYSDGAVAIKGMLDALNRNLAYSNIVLGATRPYYGERYTWNVQFLDFTYNEKVYVGRLYTTTTQLGNTYAILFGADPSEADKQFEDTFEIMLDGFQIPETLRVLRHADTGITLLYDTAWTFMQEDESYFGTSSLNSRDLIYGYFAEWNENAESFAANQMFVNSLIRTSPFETGTLNGREGVFVSYAYLQTGDEVLGYGFASVEDGIGLFITYETNQLTASGDQLKLNFERFVGTRFTFSDQLPSQATNALAGELLQERVDNSTYNVDVPRIWRGPSTTFEDVDDDGTLDAIREWRSPTDQSVFRVAHIWVYPDQIDTELSLADYATPDMRLSEIGGRAVFANDTRLVTYLPELSQVMTMEVTSNVPTLANEVQSLITQSITWDNPELTFDPQLLGDEFVYARNADEINIETLYTLTPPQGWTDWQQVGSNYFTTAPDQNRVELYAFHYETRNVVDPLSVWRYFLSLNPLYQPLGEPELFTWEDYTGLDFNLIYEQAGGVRTLGHAFLLLLPDDFAIIISAESDLTGVYKAENAINCAWESIYLDGTVAEPCEWVSTTSLMVEGISFESPEPADPMTLTAFGEEGEEVIFFTSPESVPYSYVGYYATASSNLEDSVNTTMEGWGLQLEDAEQFTSVSGIEGYIVNYQTYHIVDGEQLDVLGRGFAFISGDSLYILGLEILLDEDTAWLDEPFDLLMKSLRLP